MLSQVPILENDPMALATKKVDCYKKNQHLHLVVQLSRDVEVSAVVIVNISIFFLFSYTHMINVLKKKI